MRLTLEELKAMSDRQLFQHWLHGYFPFEKMKTCDHCLTQHGLYGVDGDSDALCSHEAIVGHISAMDVELKGRWWYDGVDALRRNLDQLYALRLFYDSLYQPADQVPDAVAMDDEALRGVQA